MSENENVAPPILDNSNNEKVEKPTETYTRLFTKSLISKQDCGIFKDFILKPDLIIDGKNYFFFPNEVKNQLENLLTETLNKYPYMFEPIRADLIKYSKSFQTEQFKSNLGFFLTVKREIYFYWNPDEKNENEWIKAKKIAFLLSQLNSQNNNYYGPNDVYISIFNKNNEIFTFDNDEMFKIINTSLSFNSNYDDDNFVIMEISKKMEYIKQFTRVSTTNFLNVIQGVYTEHKMDYGEMLVIFFQSFLNSVDSKNSVKYRKLLCLMTKMLFYNTEEMQTKFHRMIYDSNFFSNFNRSLNINIVLTIDCSKNFTLIQRTKELTDITKITIQFLQLLGEGFNTDYHENIMTNKVINKKKKKEDESDSDSDSDLELNIENNNNNTSDNISISNTNNTKTNLNEESSLIDTSSQGSK